MWRTITATVVRKQVITLSALFLSNKNKRKELVKGKRKKMKVHGKLRTMSLL